jgi:membrane-anchored protein YejM (alkaline phosphatase superfamily)
MPHLYSLSEQGVNFLNHFSGSHQRELGIFSLFYGLPNRYWSEITLNYIPPVMMTRLNEENYHFGLFSSIGMLSPEFSQSSFSELNSVQLRRFSQQESNIEMTNEWLNWDEKQSKSTPWFSFLYFKPNVKGLLQNNSNLSIKARTDKVKKYHQQVSEIDQQIGRIVADLRDNGTLKNTVVVITGTHGASFEKEDSIESTISNAHVPLVILWPNQNPRQITRMTSHLDIVPTIMEEVLLTKTSARNYTNGQSLFDNSERPYILSGNRKQFVIYEKDKITQFANDGEIKSIHWDGSTVDKKDFDVTLLIDVLSQLRQFKK